MEVMQNTIIDHAKRYAALGWKILPVLGKVPQGEAWQTRATCNDVQALFSQFSHDGVGVLLGKQSGIVDIECDSEEAETKLFELLQGEIPYTPTFASKRGKHFIFKWRECLPEKAVFKLDGLEFRIGNGAAAQSVFPPSNGRTWEIEPETPAADFPAWQAVLKQYRESEPKPKKKIATVASYQPSEERLNVPRWLNKHRIEIYGAESKDGGTWWFIECPNIKAHTTRNASRDCVVIQDGDGTLGGKCFHQSCGINDWDALRDAIGGLEHSDYAEEQPVESLIDLSQFMVEPIPQPSEPNKPAVFGFPAECLQVPGLIGEIMQYNLSTALYPRPELALAGALAMMSLITGRKIEDRWELRTNLYLIGLCNSGGGKSHAKQINNRILGRLGKQEMIMPKPKSGSGLVASLRDSNASLLQVDELADWLEIMKSPQKSPHTYEILGLLKEVYSEATNETWKPSGYADAKKNPTIASPHLTFYGVAPAAVFWQSLTRQNLTDGLVGRFLAIESTGENESNDGADRFAPPDALLERIRAWLDFAPGGGMFGGMNGTAARIQHTSEAWDRYREHGKRTEKRRTEESEESYALWCRTPEKTGKLAMLRACSRVAPIGGILPVVELSDVEWAIRLSNWSTRAALAQAGLYVAENQVEGNMLRLLRILTDWQPKSAITRKTQFLRSKEREELLRDAITSERVEIREVETGGMKRTEFRRKS